MNEFQGSSLDVNGKNISILPFQTKICRGIGGIF
jgi:hypothetical protein